MTGPDAQIPCPACSKRLRSRAGVVKHFIDKHMDDVLDGRLLVVWESDLAEQTRDAYDSGIHDAQMEF